TLPPFPIAQVLTDLTANRQARLHGCEPHDTPVPPLAYHSNDNVMQSNKFGRVRRFLLPSESIVFISKVTKRVRFRAPRERVLILTDFPRLPYADPLSETQRGEVMWTSDLRVRRPAPRHFHIETPERVFRLETDEEIVDQWIEALHDAFIGRVTPMANPASMTLDPRWRAQAVKVQLLTERLRLVGGVDLNATGSFIDLIEAAKEREEILEKDPDAATAPVCEDIPDAT
ncbi:hypothetical protein KIPB_009997, partial [Kipferlia bialata]